MKIVDKRKDVKREFQYGTVLENVSGCKFLVFYDSDLDKYRLLNLSNSSVSIDKYDTLEEMQYDLNGLEILNTELHIL